MTLKTNLITAMIVAAATLTSCKSADDPQPNGGTATETVEAAESIGTYDGRAVVIAYVNGPRFSTWMKELRTEHERAKEAGDTAKVAELEAKVQQRQDAFHRQAFEGDDVDDILELVRDELPQILAEAKVARLEKVNRDRPEGVVTVDVTDQLVALFDPNEKGRKWIADVRTKPFAK